jgi:hypothetical protein
VTFSVAGKTIAAAAGRNVFISRGQEYAFTVKTQTAQVLIAFTPAVSKEYFKELNAPTLK